ncbi:Hypothetical predicted protein [Olea europaea subsp. europaea]|uniref:Uncharacterized protein n=1 Tax=Olea europaea subsp. europaea TaxID=158383 RepID=A0A8S0S4R5_OLEEU|nr:Hypothetical predicted protein [Olea europaea subsp. europaea]
MARNLSNLARSNFQGLSSMNFNSYKTPTAQLSQVYIPPATPKNPLPGFDQPKLCEMTNGNQFGKYSSVPPVLEPVSKGFSGFPSGLYASEMQVPVVGHIQFILLLMSAFDSSSGTRKHCLHYHLANPNQPSGWIDPQIWWCSNEFYELWQESLNAMIKRNTVNQPKDKEKCKEVLVEPSKRWVLVRWEHREQHSASTSGTLPQYTSQFTPAIAMVNILAPESKHTQVQSVAPLIRTTESTIQPVLSSVAP